jgi:hypothetical protein
LAGYLARLRVQFCTNFSGNGHRANPLAERKQPKGTFMRNFCVLLAAVALISGSAFAADSNTSLAPGKPAGLRTAQDDGDNTIFYIVGVGALAVGIALLASDNHKGNSSPATTPTTQ